MEPQAVPQQRSPKLGHSSGVALGSGNGGEGANLEKFIDRNIK